jgi:hypothetical protein
MTIEEVRELVRTQSADHLEATNDHRIRLKEALVAPQEVSVILRMVKGGRVQDRILNVWMIGQENTGDGYRIVMRGDGLQFGLASTGFPDDKFFVLDGWYGDLLSAFMSM